GPRGPGRARLRRPRARLRLRGLPSGLGTVPDRRGPALPGRRVPPRSRRGRGRAARGRDRAGVVPRDAGEPSPGARPAQLPRPEGAPGVKGLTLQDTVAPPEPDW